MSDEDKGVGSDGVLSTQNDILGYWSLGPKGRGRVDSLVQKLIKSRDNNEEAPDEKPVQEGDK